MPFAYAFKDAAETARLEGFLAAAVALEIARVTRGRFSHVECWIAGPLNHAMCFSSREPVGTSIEFIDLSDAKLWTVVPVATTPEQDELIFGFCLGSSGRMYDLLGILGIGTGSELHNPFDRFCSESGFELGKLCVNLFHAPANADIRRWDVAPSGPTVPGVRWGLYELLTDAHGTTKA